MGEVVALVDASGTVTGPAERSVARRDNLRHAATAILVRNSSGQIFVHRRSPAKDWAPGCHDAAAGGMLLYGEDPRESAARELAEELGVTGAPLTSLGTNSYEDDTTRVFEHCYEVLWDGPVSFPDAEVVWGSWMTLPELGRRLRDQAWPFVPDTRALLDRLAATDVHDYAAISRGWTTAPPRLVGMSASDDHSDRALAAADALGLAYQVTRHGRVRSLEEAAAARGLDPSQIVKTIVVRLSDEDYRFVLVPGDREIAWPKLRSLLGVNRLSMPNAETALAVTGYVRGTITPLGSTTAWPVVADAAVTGKVSLGAGAHGVAVTVDTTDLVAALDAIVADVTEPVV